MPQFFGGCGVALDPETGLLGNRGKPARPLGCFDQTGQTRRGRDPLRSTADQDARVDLPETPDALRGKQSSVERVEGRPEAPQLRGSVIQIVFPWSLKPT